MAKGIETIVGLDLAVQAGQAEQLPDTADRWQRGEGWLLAGIVALAFLLRLPGVLADPVLLTEGTTYVTIARNLRAGRGYVGILGGPDWFISPFYPWLIAAVSFLTADAELAGRLISLLTGSFLPLPVYWLARQCFGRRAATWAALIVAGMPILVAYSAVVWSETLYTFLVFLSLALAWRALQRKGTLAALAAGLFFACAYLTRTEGFVYLLLFAAAIALLALLTGRWRQWAVMLAAALAGFLLLAAPYVVALSLHSGQLTLESKGRVNFLIVARMDTGLDYQQAAYGLSPEGELEGPFLRREWILTHGWPPDAPPLSLMGRLRHLLRNLRLEATVLQGQLLSSLLVLLAAFGAVAQGWDLPTLRRRGWSLLAGLALAFVLPRPLLPAWAIGVVLLFGDGWTRKRLAPLAFLCAFPLVSLPVVAMAPAIFARYLVPLLPFAAIFAGLGVDRLADWAAESALSASAPNRRAWLRRALALALVGALLLSLPRASVATYRQEQDQDQRRAGLWLQAYDPSPAKRILSVFSQIPYYAGGIHLPMPDGTPESVAAYARAQGADYVVICPRRLNNRPGLAAWQRGERIPSTWEPIYRDDSAEGGSLIIYRVLR
ncbi:MAG: glycosyltransferase family 39 protein [Anaerolineae bacterium]|nr:glycosyltransferase family 39 protein [Anaerolineae bacterium]